MSALPGTPGSSYARDLAREQIESEFEGVNSLSGFAGTMKAMGWPSVAPSILARAANHFQKEQAWTSRDVDRLERIVAKLSRAGSDTFDIYEDNKVRDYLTNLVAGYMQQSLKVARGGKAKKKRR